MKTHIQELIACYRTFDEITDIIESENSGLSAEQRLSDIEVTIKNLFKNGTHLYPNGLKKYMKGIRYNFMKWIVMFKKH